MQMEILFGITIPSSKAKNVLHSIPSIWHSSTQMNNTTVTFFDCVAFTFTFDLLYVCIN